MIRQSDWQQDKCSSIHMFLFRYEIVLSIWAIRIGILLRILILVLTSASAEAVTETQLSNQEMTLSGKLFSPSCTVRLENSHLIFSYKQGNTTSLNKQFLKLSLSQCDIDSVGIMFKAEHWPEYPARGIFREVTSKERNDLWYYTVSPGIDDNSGFPLLLSFSTDSPIPRIETSSGDESNGLNFSLAAVNYWFEITTPLRERDELTIPFSIQVHHRLASADKMQDGPLEANFTLQISWK
ncbi:hypothetical protein [Providencia rettgeri]|uniref:hypothetical protein n=1 Tax=Providencia rettgeri TaxID=587 RepID=UPI001419699A|nr:hypothetical protein [Providencia rettgeri]NIH07133.1 hypothetical protein [Providencia rettgeri]